MTPKVAKEILTKGNYISEWCLESAEYLLYKGDEFVTTDAGGMPNDSIVHSRDELEAIAMWLRDPDQVMKA